MSSPGQYTGRSLGSVKLLDRIGSGGMGEVYKGFHEVLEMEVAVKVILPNQTANADFIKRFVREAQACAQLSHPNILRVFTADKADDLYHIVLEYVDGTDLKAVLRRHKRIPWEKTVAIIEQACAGLAYAHKKGIVHRDIKPDNLLISRKGEIKIADFGLATIRAEVTGITAAGQVLGTPLYMSPEQCDGQVADWRSDIYSLGATWYHLIAGRPPYVGDSTAAVIAQHLIKDVAFPKDRFEDVPERIRALIAWMMRRDREQRVQNLEEIRAQLAAIDHASQRERREVVKEVVDVTRRLEAQQYRGTPSSNSNGMLTPHVYQEAIPIGGDPMADLRSSGRLPTVPPHVAGQGHPSSSNRIPAPQGYGHDTRSSQQMPVYGSGDVRASQQMPVPPPPPPIPGENYPTVYNPRIPSAGMPPVGNQPVPVVPMDVRNAPMPITQTPPANLRASQQIPVQIPPEMQGPADSGMSQSNLAGQTTDPGMRGRSDRMPAIQRSPSQSQIPASSGTWRAPKSQLSQSTSDASDYAVDAPPAESAPPWAFGGTAGVPMHASSSGSSTNVSSAFHQSSSDSHRAPLPPAEGGFTKVIVGLVVVLVLAALGAMIFILAQGVTPSQNQGAITPPIERAPWVFFSRRLGPLETDLYKIRLDGSELVQLTTKPGSEEYPAISPSGRMVAFVHRTESQTNLVMIRSDGSGWINQNLSTNSNVRGPLVWAPHGSSVYFSNFNGEFCDFHFGSFPSFDRKPMHMIQIGQFDILHEERRVIATDNNATGSGARLWAAPLPNLDKTQQIGVAANAKHPRISPNGLQLLYLEADPDNSGFGRLMVADVNGRDPLPLEFPNLRAYGRPAWTPDGRIVFAAKYVPDENAGTENGEDAGSEQATAGSAAKTAPEHLEWNIYVANPPMSSASLASPPIPILSQSWQVEQVDSAAVKGE